MLSRTLVLELDGEVVGDLYLHVEDGWAQHEVARRPGSRRRDRLVPGLAGHQGQGYATEAATELVRICFEDLGLRRVTAGAFADNPPSLRVMEKLGMRRRPCTVRSRCTATSAGSTASPTRPAWRVAFRR